MLLINGGTLLDRRFLCNISPLCRNKGDDDIADNMGLSLGWRGEMVRVEKPCMCPPPPVFSIWLGVSLGVCVCMSRTEGLKRLNLGHSETTPLWGILTAGRLAYWCPICMAPCPAQGIGLFPFPSSLPPALHLERLLPSSSTAFFS